MNEEFGIGQAVKEMQDGNKVSRKGWNGPGQYLQIKKSGRGAEMSLPYVFIETTQRETVPWLCSQSDLLAVDWFVVGP